MIGFSVDLRTARGNAIVALLDAAVTPAKCLCYGMPRPNNADTAITTQLLIAEVPLAKPCGTVVNGVLALATTTATGNAVASGSIGWVRVVDGSGKPIMDMDASDTDSNSELFIDTLAVVVGDPITITGFVVIEDGS